MKTKTLTKKLILNKETVADLEDKEMTHVLGGVVATIKLCTSTLATNSCLSTRYCC